MTRRNDDRPTVDKVDLTDNESDEHGWPYGLILGLDYTRGWALEFDMEDGVFGAALTPAGVDPILLMQATEKQDAEGRWHSTVTIKAEANATWDAATKTLTIGGQP